MTYIIIFGNGGLRKFAHKLLTAHRQDLNNA